MESELFSIVITAQSKTLEQEKDTIPKQNIIFSQNTKTFCQDTKLNFPVSRMSMEWVRKLK